MSRSRSDILSIETQVKNAQRDHAVQETFPGTMFQHVHIRRHAQHLRKSRSRRFCSGASSMSRLIMRHACNSNRDLIRSSMLLSQDEL